MEKGKIIVITGAPRTGKSTLTSLLSQHLDATPFLEGEEEDLPTRTLENIKKQENLFELCVWFRNKLISSYLDAIRVKEKGGTAILDTFWLTNDVYADEWIDNEFEKAAFLELSGLDSEMLPFPDLVISLSSDEKRIEEFSIAGDRKFEQTEEFLQKKITLNKKHEAYFRGMDRDEILFINRSELDFYNQEHFLQLVKKVKDKLSI